MLALLLAVAAWVPPLCAFGFAVGSSARHVLAYAAFYWTVPVLALSVAAWTNYSVVTRPDGDGLRVLTIRGRRRFDLRRLVRMTSFSMWGYGSTRAFRLYGDDRSRVMVVLGGPFTSYSRRNSQQAADVRAALQPYAELADERGRWWLGAGPRPARSRGAGHVLRMAALYALGVVSAFVLLVVYLSNALPTLH